MSSAPPPHLLYRAMLSIQVLTIKIIPVNYLLFLCGLHSLVCVMCCVLVNIPSTFFSEYV